MPLLKKLFYGGLFDNLDRIWTPLPDRYDVKESPSMFFDVSLY